MVRIPPPALAIQGAKAPAARGAWDTAVKKIGLPDRTPHALRRSAIRELVRAGVTEKVAMGISGHKTRDVFDRYNITSKDDLQDAATMLAARHEKEAGGSRTVLPLERASDGEKIGAKGSNRRVKGSGRSAAKWRWS